jgi:hypothetical protein
MIRSKYIFCICLTAVSMLTFAALVRAEESKNDHLEINPADFSRHSNVIDNKWWPMEPGVQMTYDGYAKEDGDQVRRSIVTTYTDMTKVIGGVRVAIMLEDDYNDKKLEEREIAFHAQDKAGNVWHLGQLRESFEDHQFKGGSVWFVGHPTGAKAGIRMWAKPKVGSVASQGYAPPPFYWTDRGRVSQMGLKTNVAAGNYENVMVVDEWDEETPKGVYQTKYYAAGVGNVRVGFRGPDPEEEELELVKIEHLDATAMAKVREKVHAVEDRAYIYAHTKPAQDPPTGGS